MDFADGVPGVESEPSLTVPTYLTFIAVMMTAVTVVLAAVAIGIGVVAAFTIQEIRDRADKTSENARQQAEAAVENALAAVEKALSEEAIDKRLANFVRGRQGPTAAELEEDFDPNDTGER